MAKDVADVLGNAIGKVAREAAKSMSQGNDKSPHGVVDRMNDAVSERMKHVSGSKGLAVGAGVATLVPLAAKGAGKLVRGIGSNGGGPVQKAGDKLGGKVKDAVGDQVEKAGGAGGIAKEAGKSMLPGGGGGKSKGQPGVGKGRRMPIQQDIDIGVPVSTVYNQWTQFEEWPKFMHRLQSVSQEDETHVSFKTKIWGISKEFKAEIVEQRPDERIKWQVTEGLTHTGVVTFHELGPRLTRVELNFDVQPGSLIEKAARGMRHVKRAVRADMARFKAYVLMQEQESGAWRGEIEDGDVKSRSSGSSSSSSSSSSGSSSSGSSSSGRSRSGSKRSRGGRKSSSSPRKSSSSSTSARKSSSTPARKSSSTTARKSSPTASKRSSGARKQSGSGSSNGRSRTTASSNGRSSSSRTRASSNGGGSNGRSRSSSAKKRSGARS